MDSAADASEFVPKSRSLRTLAQAAKGCQGCELFREATQTVFGSGPRTAHIMLVGEQPGDVEDQRGERSSGRPASCWTPRSLTRASFGTRSI